MIPGGVWKADEQISLEEDAIYQEMIYTESKS